MILSDTDIRARLAQGDLKVGPLEDEQLQIQPASIDVRLAHEFIVYRSNQVACLDPRDPRTISEASQKVHLQEGGAFILHPGEFALGSTIEEVAIPHDLVATVDGRSSIGRLAVVIHATAGFIDPGFRGQITLELSNIGPIPVKLYPNMRVAQLVFHELKSPSTLPYGEEGRGSSYQDQRGPQTSKIKLSG